MRVCSGQILSYRFEDSNCFTTVMVEVSETEYQPLHAMKHAEGKEKRKTVQQNGLF